MNLLSEVHPPLVAVPPPAPPSVGVVETIVSNATPSLPSWTQFVRMSVPGPRSPEVPGSNV